MKIKLIHLDGKLPNLALMKLSHWFKSKDVEVDFSKYIYPKLWDYERSYSAVYASAIFTTSHSKILHCRRQWPNAVIGGTGTESSTTVESIIGDEYEFYDYEIYPEFRDSIGFTQRGCRLNCKFCVVPKKEGKPRSINTIQQIYRGHPYPKNINLLDNDFFGQDQWQERIKEIKDGGFKVCFQQGINIRIITEESSEGLASVEYRNTKFNKRKLYTAWDNLRDEKIFFRGVELLERAGIPPNRLRVYMLTGYDPDETWERIHYRFNRMAERGIEPYPMVYNNKRKDLKAFQRWAVTGLYRAVPFAEYRDSRLKIGGE